MKPILSARVPSSVEVWLDKSQMMVLPASSRALLKAGKPSGTLFFGYGFPYEITNPKKGALIILWLLLYYGYWASKKVAATLYTSLEGEATKVAATSSPVSPKATKGTAQGSAEASSVLAAWGLGIR